MTPPADNEGSGSSGGFVGGGATAVLPLDIKRYVVKEGETLSGIAERLDLDLDTLASLNRQWGSGVHLVRVGEEIMVPNQDGIYLAVEASLEKQCAAKGVPVEAVLAVNRVAAGEAKPGVKLFFPGVQHTGIERSVIVGSAFLRPVAGWSSSAFGYRHDPFNDTIQFHRGIDIAAAPGHGRARGAGRQGHRHRDGSGARSLYRDPPPGGFQHRVRPPPAGVRQAGEHGGPRSADRPGRLHRENHRPAPALRGAPVGPAGQPGGGLEHEALGGKA